MTSDENISRLSVIECLAVKGKGRSRVIRYLIVMEVLTSKGWLDANQVEILEEWPLSMW